jgi:hypothetical protein
VFFDFIFYLFAKQIFIFRKRQEPAFRLVLGWITPFRKHRKECRGLSNGKLRAYNNPFVRGVRLLRTPVGMLRLDFRRCLAWSVHHQALERIAVRY